jgi:hypothetical protein
LWPPALQQWHEPWLSTCRVLHRSMLLRQLVLVACQTAAHLLMSSTASFACRSLQVMLLGPTWYYTHSVLHDCTVSFHMVAVVVPQQAAVELYTGYGHLWKATCVLLFHMREDLLYTVQCGCTVLVCWQQLAMSASSACLPWARDTASLLAVTSSLVTPPVC